MATISAVSVVGLLAAAIVSTVFGFNAANQRTLANQRLVQADRDAAISLATEKFLNEDMLSGANPNMVKNPNMTVRQALDNASEKIQGRFTDMPVVEAAVRSTLGQTYNSLGEHDTAESHLSRALSLLYAEVGAEHRRTIAAELIRASVLRQKGRYDEAESTLKRLKEIADRRPESDDLLPLTILNELARVYFDNGQYDDAEEILRELLTDIDRLGVGQKQNFMLKAMNQLSLVLLKQDKKDAEALLQISFSIVQAQYSPGNKKCVELYELFQRLYGVDGLDDPTELENARSKLIDDK